MLTIEEVKQYLHLDSDAEDDYLRILIILAGEMCENYTRLAMPDELPESYLKVWRSYCSVRDAALADNDTKELIHRRVLELQQKKKLTNYRLYKDLRLNPGNVNAWLKHNDSSKMSLDCARQIYKYAKSYPSVR